MEKEVEPSPNNILLSDVRGTGRFGSEIGWFAAQESHGAVTRRKTPFHQFECRSVTAFDVRPFICPLKAVRRPVLECNKWHFPLQWYANREPFPASKNVPVDTVLQLVSRVLTLNTKTLTKCAHANFGESRSLYFSFSWISLCHW